MHGNNPRDTEGKGSGAAQSHRQGAHVEVWHLNSLRKSGQAPRLVHEELHEKAGHHRQGELPTRDLLQHSEASLFQEFQMEPRRSVNEGRSHSGSGDPHVSTIRENQGRSHRKVQRPVWLLVDSAQRDAQLSQNLGAADEVQRSGSGFPDADDEAAQVLQSGARVDLLLR